MVSDGSGSGATDGAQTEGRRERKKRETRQRISDIATGLRLERGFAAVTIAEIADSANVSVNTVYNYFPAKEDLFFDRAEEMTSRPSRIVRERGPGESAAHAVLSRLREDVSERNLYGGVVEGYDAFMRCIQEAPSLMARLFLMQQRTADQLALTLREEVSPPRTTPRRSSSPTNWCTSAMSSSGKPRAGSPRGATDEVVRAALRRIDTFESLVADALLNYAVRPGG